MVNLKPFTNRTGNTTITVTSRRAFDKLILLGVTDQRLRYKGLRPPAKATRTESQTLITKFLING